MKRVERSPIGNPIENRGQVVATHYPPCFAKVKKPHRGFSLGQAVVVGLRRASVIPLVLSAVEGTEAGPRFLERSQK